MPARLVPGSTRGIVPPPKNTNKSEKSVSSDDDKTTFDKSSDTSTSKSNSGLGAAAGAAVGAVTGGALGSAAGRKDEGPRSAERGSHAAPHVSGQGIVKKSQQSDSESPLAADRGNHAAPRVSGQAYVKKEADPTSHIQKETNLGALGSTAAAASGGYYGSQSANVPNEAKDSSLVGTSGASSEDLFDFYLAGIKQAAHDAGRHQAHIDAAYAAGVKKATDKEKSHDKSKTLAAGTAGAGLGAGAGAATAAGVSKAAGKHDSAGTGSTGSHDSTGTGSIGDSSFGSGGKSKKPEPLVEVIGVHDREKAQKLALKATRDLAAQGEDVLRGKIVVNANTKEIFIEDHSPVSSPSGQTSKSAEKHRGSEHSLKSGSSSSTSKEAHGEYGPIPATAAGAAVGAGIGAPLAHHAGYRGGYAGHGDVAHEYEKSHPGDHDRYDPSHSSTFPSGGRSEKTHTGHSSKSAQTDRSSQTEGHGAHGPIPANAAGAAVGAGVGAPLAHNAGFRGDYSGRGDVVSDYEKNHPSDQHHYDRGLTGQSDKSDYSLYGKSDYPLSGKSDYPLTGKSNYPQSGYGQSTQSHSEYPSQSGYGQSTQSRSDYPSQSGYGQSDYSSGQSGYGQSDYGSHGPTPAYATGAAVGAGVDAPEAHHASRKLASDDDPASRYKQSHPSAGHREELGALGAGALGGAALGGAGAAYSKSSQPKETSQPKEPLGYREPHSSVAQEKSQSYQNVKVIGVTDTARAQQLAREAVVAVQGRPDILNRTPELRVDASGAVTDQNGEFLIQLGRGRLLVTDEYQPPQVSGGAVTPPVNARQKTDVPAGAAASLSHQPAQESPLKAGYTGINQREAQPSLLRTETKAAEPEGGSVMPGSFI